MKVPGPPEPPEPDGIYTPEPPSRKYILSLKEQIARERHAVLERKHRRTFLLTVASFILAAALVTLALIIISRGGFHHYHQ
jgi:hypothetical protein